MKYNAKYDRYVTKGGLVYRYDSKQDKLILCKLSNSRVGYLLVCVSKPEITMIYVHRLVYETFNGDIPEGYQIDHINTIRTDNSLGNLRCVTPRENCNNPLTRKHVAEARTGCVHAEDTKKKISESKKGKVRSEFGEKFKKHFGINFYENTTLYRKEQMWYRRHKKCRWE